MAEADPHAHRHWRRSGAGAWAGGTMSNRTGLKAPPTTTLTPVVSEPSRPTTNKPLVRFS